jgi:predicted nucleic acid-binding protein
VKILFDVNVVLDVLLDRDEWVAESASLLDLAERGKVNGYVAGHTITTVHYIVARAAGRRRAATAVTDLLRILHVVPIAEPDFAQALVLGFKDFEDAVQAAAALEVGADYVATRNVSDFKSSPVRPRSPGELLALIKRPPSP